MNRESPSLQLSSLLKLFAVTSLLLIIGIYTTGTCLCVRFTDLPFSVKISLDFLDLCDTNAEKKSSINGENMIVSPITHRKLLITGKISD